MKTAQKLFLLAISFVSVVVACKTNTPDPTQVVSDKPYIPPADMVSVISSSVQRAGDATKGFDYLINGDYVSSGFPLTVYNSALKGQGLGKNELNRTGDAASIPYNFNLTKHANGTDIIVPNCLQCHAQTLDNQLVIGLGSTTYDLTKGQVYGGNSVGIDQGTLAFVAGIIQNRSTKEYEAFEPLYTAATATSKYLTTDVVGSNSADKLAAVLTAYRDKNSLIWLGTPQVDLNNDVFPTDVPAWWLMKKKNSMFFAGWGRGDFSRIMMAAGLLTMKDTTEARKIDNRFPDVLAYIKSISPPKYKQNIDQNLVKTGLKVFTNNCAGCHGTYEMGNVTYPNYVVSLDLVKTDSYLINDAIYKNVYFDWYNTSWFAKNQPAANLAVTKGYVAPPLDGVWATAPYLHNGSVPTLDDLLNSSQRPKFWRKIIDKATGAINLDSYDYAKVGWQYTSESSKTDKFTYDTTKNGYGNGGHYFGDGLSNADRKALIEYLKTL